MDNGGENSFRPSRGRARGRPRLNHQPLAAPTTGRGSISGARRTRTQHVDHSDSTG
jgi:hypothetical protein